MSISHVSGPLQSDNGFIGSVTATSPLVVGSTSISEAEIGVLDAVTPGTAAASKAIVLGASKDIATITSATITTMTGNVVGNITGNVTGNVTGNITGNVTGNMTGNMTGYRVGDPAASQCTIAVAAGASNVCGVTIQVKDGAGTNIAKIVPFTLYASSASDGLTLASAASTGFAVSSGGMSLANGTAVTTSIRGVTSATGGCVLTLTDTGKQTSYLVLVLDDGVKISAQLASGDYGA